jgi:phenylacetate-CoA ligase
MLHSIAKIDWHLSASRGYPGIHRLLKDLISESRLSPLTWQELRVRRLRDLLAFARDHVPYYRDLFQRVSFAPESADLPQDLHRIPLLTKQLVAEHLDELIADNAHRSYLTENATGGSTGRPLRFYQDRRYVVTAAALDAYVRTWWGIKPHDRTASIWGADREFRELSWKERYYNWRRRVRSINAFRMTESELIDFCRMILRWQPPYMVGYSSALEALASCANAHGIGNVRFRAIRSAAEVLWPHQRRLIEDAFQTPVYDFYGSREVNNLAAECPEGRRLHLISTWRYVEIADNDGKPLPDGNLGNVVVTDLSNYSMPFIRYRNEDIAAIADNMCSCDRPSPVLAKLHGRSSDLIRTPRGEIVHGEYFTHLFYGTGRVRQFQVHQTALDRIVIRYVPSDARHPELTPGVVERIRDRLGAELNVEVEACERIPIPPSGKHRFTISDVEPCDWHRDMSIVAAGQQ